MERIRIPTSSTQAARKILKRESCTLGVASLKCSDARESPSRDGTQRPVARQLSNYKIHADQQVREVPTGKVSHVATPRASAIIKTCKLLTDEAHSYWFPWNKNIYHNTCISSLFLCFCDYINGDWTLCWRWEAIMKASFVFEQHLFSGTSRNAVAIPPVFQPILQHERSGIHPTRSSKVVLLSYVVNIQVICPNFGDLWIKSGWLEFWM